MHGKGILVNLITYVCQSLQVLEEFELIHGCLTPDNILVEFNEYNTILETLRIVGFHSAVHHSQIDRLNYYFPEYMPPEFLNYQDAGCDSSR